MHCHPSRIVNLAIAIALGATLALSGCGESATGTDVAHNEFELVRPVPPAAVPGWPLHDTVSVRLVDDAGAPMSGVAVTWTLTGGGGTITPLGSTTDANGVASLLWTLGSAPGANTLNASAADASLTITSIGLAFQADRVDAGYELGCGLVSGALWCWGISSWVSSPAPSDRPDPTGYAPTSSPGLVDDTHGFIDLAVGDQAVCALDEQGITWCADLDHPEVAEVAGLPPMRFITRARTRFCGLASADSTAWCWTGTGTATAAPDSPALVNLHLGFPSTEPIYCGLRADSTAVCWGTGPLGDGTSNSSATPVAVSGDHHFQDLAAGDGFACGLTAAGEVWCWGKDWVNGVGGAPDLLEPVLAVSGASEIAANDIFAVALKSGEVIAWQGAGFDATPVPGFTDIAGLDGLSVASFALNSNSCVRLTDGQVYCWDKMWDGSTAAKFNLYTPVQPVIPPTF